MCSRQQELSERGVTALGPLNSLDFVAQAPVGPVGPIPKKSNPTNYMRPTEVGAFILPSVGRVPLHPLSDTQTCAKARQTARKPDLAHGRGFRWDVVTNRPLDCGASAVQSSAVLSVDGGPPCASVDA